jgi:hypothetical protein
MRLHLIRQTSSALPANRYWWILQYSGHVTNVRFDVLTAVIVQSSVFWYMTPCSLLKSKKPGWSMRQAQVSCFTLVSYVVYFSTLKMEATCSSETSSDFQRTTRRSIPEDRTLRIIEDGSIKEFIGFLIYFTDLQDLPQNCILKMPSLIMVSEIVQNSHNSFLKLLSHKWNITGVQRAGWLDIDSHEL